MPDAKIPADRKYLASHEWHQLANGQVTIGITHLAADELTDITFVDLPKVGETFDANSAFGEVESVKATSDLYTGVGGEVIAVNPELSENPGIINSDPYGAGWMIRIKPTDPAAVDKLLSADDYAKSSGH